VLLNGIKVDRISFRELVNFCSDGYFKLPVDDVKELHSGVIVRSDLRGRQIVEMREKGVELPLRRAEVEALKVVGCIPRLRVRRELYSFAFT